MSDLEGKSLKACAGCRDFQAPVRCPRAFDTAIEGAGGEGCW